MVSGSEKLSLTLAVKAIIKAAVSWQKGLTSPKQSKDENEMSEE